MDALGDRMKEYEREETGQRFVPGQPVYARIDGRGFSTFTKGLERPYDEHFRKAMLDTTLGLVAQTDAVVGYTQSDEISVCWCPQTQDAIFFAGKKQKMVSQLAALTTALFAHALRTSASALLQEKIALLPTFDARVFQLPNEQECVNAFIWRELDATKNALSMAARCCYSHRELQQKNSIQLRQMLADKGIDFEDYPVSFRRGVYARRQAISRTLTPQERAALPPAHRPPEGTTFTRHQVNPVDLPPLVDVANPIETLLYGHAPQLRSSRSPDRIQERKM